MKHLDGFDVLRNMAFILGLSLLITVAIGLSVRLSIPDSTISQDVGPYQHICYLEPRNITMDNNYVQLPDKKICEKVRFERK